MAVLGVSALTKATVATVGHRDALKLICNRLSTGRHNPAHRHLIYAP